MILFANLFGMYCTRGLDIMYHRKWMAKNAEMLEVLNPYVSFSCKAMIGSTNEAMKYALAPDIIAKTNCLYLRSFKTGIFENICLF